jgi:hypothetical protein
MKKLKKFTKYLSTAHDRAESFELSVTRLQVLCLTATQPSSIDWYDGQTQLQIIAKQYFVYNMLRVSARNGHYQVI